MKRLAVLAICAGFATLCESQVEGGIAEVAVVDRDSGAVLSAHFFRGEYWVAGRPGARYAIEIRNRSGERMLAVASVDGVNVVSGATAAWDQTGYVFGAGERYQITGWRKSDAEVAAFTFTDSPNSYAARTGRPGNVGVIGVAIFRERPPQPAYVPPVIGESSGRMQAPRAAQFDSAMAASKLGTGHGEREYSYVNHTEFQRMQAQPNEVIRIRYDSLDNLFAMGIIKRPRPALPGINPFPASPAEQYVPDPQG